MTRSIMHQEHGQHFSFHGSVGTLFGIVFMHWLLTILTLGLYHFWGKTKVRRYLYSQTEFDGDRFHYHGTGWELCRGFLKALCLLAPVLSSLYFLPKIWAVVCMYVGLFALLPFALFGAFRYRMSRTSWRGVHFNFRGTLSACYALYLQGLLVPLTLGLYLPRYSVKMHRYWISHTYFGNTPLTYDGFAADLTDFFMSYWLRTLVVGVVIAVAAAVVILNPQVLKMMQMQGGLVAVVIAGLSLGLVMMWTCWWPAAAHRYHWGHVGFQKAHCYSDMSGGALLVLYIVHTLVMLCTLGLGCAWVMVDKMRFTLSRLTIAGYLDFEQVQQDIEAVAASGTETEA